MLRRSGCRCRGGESLKSFEKMRQWLRDDYFCILKNNGIGILGDKTKNLFHITCSPRTIYFSMAVLIRGL